MIVIAMLPISGLIDELAGGIVPWWVLRRTPHLVTGVGRHFDIAAEFARAAPTSVRRNFPGSGRTE
jgi:hypothetical protein